MPQIDYEHLWNFLQREDAFEDENRIWLNGYYYLGALDIGENPRVEISGSDEILYCTSKEDLPRIVGEFIGLGSSIGSVLRGCRQYEDHGRLSSKAEKKQLLESQQPLSHEDQNLIAFSKDILDEQLGILFFKRSDIDPEILECLSKDNELADLKEFIAISPSATTKTSQLLMPSNEEEPEPEIQFAIRTKDLLPEAIKFASIHEKTEIINKTALGSEILLILSEHPNAEIRKSIALSEHTPPEILKAFENDDDETVKSALIERSLPAEIQKLSNPEKCQYVYDNNLSDDVLCILGKIRDKDLKVAVSLRVKEESPILKLLKNDRDEFVAFAANTERYLPKSVRPSQFEFWSLEGEAQDLDISDLGEDALASIIRYPNSSFAIGLSMRSDLPEAAQISLSLHDDDDVRRNIAKSLFTRKDVLIKMLDDDEDFIRSLAQENLDFIDCPIEWREMDTWARTERIAEDDSLTNDLATVFSKASYFRVRQALTRNNMVSKEILEKLLDDDSEEVRASARESLDRRHI